MEQDCSIQEPSLLVFKLRCFLVPIRDTVHHPDLYHQKIHTQALQTKSPGRHVGWLDGNSIPPNQEIK